MKRSPHPNTPSSGVSRNGTGPRLLSTVGRWLEPWRERALSEAEARLEPDETGETMRLFEAYLDELDGDAGCLPMDVSVSGEGGDREISEEDAALRWRGQGHYYLSGAEYQSECVHRLDDGRLVRFRRVEDRLDGPDPEGDAGDGGKHGKKSRGKRDGRGRECRYTIPDSDPVRIEGDDLVILRVPHTGSARCGQSRISDEDARTILSHPELALPETAPFAEILGAPREGGRSLLALLLDEQARRLAADRFLPRDRCERDAARLRRFLERRFWSFDARPWGSGADSVVTADEEIEPEAEALADRLAPLMRVRHAAQVLLTHRRLRDDLDVRLWRARKFVIARRVLITLDRVPPAIRGELAGMNKQLHAWDDDARARGDAPVTETLEAFGGLSDAFVKAHPHLVVDTGLLPASITNRLFDGLLGGDDGVDGILVKGDNFHALRLLEARFRDRVQMVYIDPPFNTEGDGFLYDDRFRHGSWLTLMDNRLELVAPLLHETGTFYAHIDYNEKERLRLLLDRRLAYVTEIIWRIGWVSGYKTRARKFIRNHDTIYQYGHCKSPFFVKTYIPYPEGYRRRDGKKPKGEGLPLEDTWNACSADPLHSIQIMSFSREKVGDDQLTQKNENLLERMIRSSTREGDRVLDYFLGSGTTAAAAHKMGRRWIGIERGGQFDRYALPRLKRVLAGDRYGISEAWGWKGGGCFEALEIETFPDLLAAVELVRPGPGFETATASERESSRDGGKNEGTRIRILLDPDRPERPLRLDPPVFRDPFRAFKNRPDPGTGAPRPAPVDLIETFRWLLGLEVIRRVSRPGFLALHGEVRRPAIEGEPEDAGKETPTRGSGRETVLVIWWDAVRHDRGELEAFFRSEACAPDPERPFFRILVNGAGPPILCREGEDHETTPIEPLFEARLLDMRSCCLEVSDS